MKAIVTKKSFPKRLLSFSLGRQLGQGAQVTEIPVPEINDDEVLVKVSAAALNPIDCKDIDVISPWNSLTGCDYAGTVTKVGNNAGSQWKIGDRIAGFVHGGQYPDIGSFAEYLKVDASLAWKVPDAVSDTDAATYGISAVTAALALTYLDVSWPDLENGRQSPPAASRSPILIYSGASNVGLFAIQLAKRAGLEVVVTASPRSFDLVKRYGADAVFDYRSPAVANEITKAYPNIRRAVDCYSEGKSTEFCAGVLNSGKVITLLGAGKPTRPDVEYTFLMVFTAFGKQFQMMKPLGPVFPVAPGDGELMRKFYAALPALAGDDLKPPATTVTSGGLEGVLKGLDRLRKRDTGGTKLVVEF
ncbi:putative ToxD-like zinc binding oxidoreductase [Aspergillus pseudoustus]|uniref:ToxD-like zinc binding oxidoreductase n=1 Tax=Aspergillus pseudoustus TaxID=1810923 RepID=A0ABR4IJQ2_9EURO